MRVSKTEYLENRAKLKNFWSVYVTSCRAANPGDGGIHPPNI